MLALFAIWASLITPASAQTGSCVAVKSTVKALKSGSDPKIFESIYAGEPLKVVAVTRDRKHYKVNLGGEAYWIVAKDVETLSASSCEPLSCVYLGSDTTVHSRPNKQATTQIVDEGVFQTVTRVKSWYRVKLASGFIWMTGAQYKNSQHECGEPVDADVVERANRSTKPLGWLFGLEAGYIVNVSSEAIQNLVTPRPADGVDVNDDAFNSPFIDSVTDGMGWYAGATVEFPMFWSLRNKIAVGYKTRSLEYVERPNPHNGSISFITYDELVPQTVAYDFTFVYATTTIKYEGWDFIGLNWQPGITLGIDYALDEFTKEFRSAPQKLTIYYVESGYREFEFLYGPRLDINWGFLNVGLSAILTGYGMEPTASIGVQF